MKNAVSSKDVKMVLYVHYILVTCVFRMMLYFLSQIFQANNPVYQFLSGVRITPKTVFLDPTEETEMQIIREIHHYMHFAVAVYGWPMYLRKNTATGICKLCSSLRYVNIVHNIPL